MDDDDEFGDLYTDVLTPFSSSLSSFQQVTLPASTPTPPPPVTHPISINLQSVDDGGLFAPSNATFSSSNQPDRQAPVVEPQKQEPEDFDFNVSAPDSKADREFEDLTEGGKDELVEISKNLEVGSGSEEIGARVLEGGDVNLAGIYEKDGFELDTGAPEEVGVGNNDDFVWKEVKFGIEEEDDGMIRDFGEDPMIPGLGTSGLSQGRLKKSGGDEEKNGNLMRKDCAGGGDEWDSDDSEDDLQIVLNDNNHGSMSMERRGMVGSDDDDDDEDGEPLVIVSDTDAVHQPAEEQEWGEDAGQTADGEGKEIPEAGKVNGGIAVAPKVGYSNFGYHPFHSQFKYVRPGAAPLPSGPPVASGGAPGQVRPPTRIGAIAGHGRGDWRPTGIKAAAPTQKGFLPGFWGSNMSGRGFGGGLEFTLPSHRTIFEVDIDSFEEKPWKYPGIDLSVFFNFGLNEETWKEYCKQLEQIRLESTMQCRIRVYESGRSGQEFDPELPPELAAAAGRDPLAENTDAHKLKVGENDLEKAPCVRPSIPIGKAIQVEVGYSERLPSVDTRPPRYRECDAVIEIVLDGDSTVVDEASAQPDLGDTKGNQKVDEAQEDSPRVGNRNSHEDPHTCHDSKVDGAMKKSQDANPIQDDIPEEEGYSPSPLRSPIEYHDGSSGDSPANSYENISLFEERQTKARTQERSTSSGDGGGLHGVSPDDQEEESTESIRRKHSPDPSSPVPPKDPSFEDIIPSEDEPVQADGSLDSKRENVVPKGTNKLHSTRIQKLSSHVEPLMLEVDDGDNLKGGKSSESSKATRSSRDPEKRSDGVDEEVIQDGRSIYSGDLKRYQHEDGQAFRRKDCDVRLESETNYLSVKGRGDRYSHREWDPYAAQHFLTKAEGLERRKEKDYADGTSLYWRDEDPIKHERADEMIRHRGKIRESERTDKDEQLHSRKLSENGSWRSYDKDAGLHYRDSTEDLHYKRRKDDVHLRWEHIDKEEVLLAHRETSGHRKRERDEQLRDNSNDCHSVRRKDDSWLQRERTERPRERDQWNRSKQSFEESLTRRERDDGRGIARVIHSRLNDDYKGYDKDYLYKDTGRTGELLTRKERVEDQRYSQHRGSEDVFAHDNQFIQDEKRSRPDRFGARSDHVVHPYDSQRVHEKRHKESRKARESEGGLSKRNREQKIGRVEMAGRKGTVQAKVQHEDDGQQSSKRGRFKLERWAIHRERKIDIDSKSSSSLKVKDTNKDNGVVSGYSANVLEVSARNIDMFDSNPSMGDGKDVGSRDTKDTDSKPMEDRHLDTVEKLKKRSERFKLPMPIEKDSLTIKKMESAPLPSSQGEAPANLEVKPERPTRKRRWISS